MTPMAVPIKAPREKVATTPSTVMTKQAARSGEWSLTSQSPKASGTQMSSTAPRKLKCRSVPEPWMTVVDTPGNK